MNSSGISLTYEDPGVAVSDFINDVKNIISESYYKTKKNNKRNSKQRKDWITPGLIQSCNTKELLYNLCKLNPQNIDLKKQYKEYVKILDKLIKKSKIIA